VLIPASLSPPKETLVRGTGLETCVFARCFELFWQTAAACPGVFLATTGTMPVELVIGRWLAWCSHPVAAWRVLPMSGRVLILASYFVSSYAAVLLALIAFKA